MAAFPAIGAASPELPFVGGWIGFFSYEAGLGIEGIGGASRREQVLPAVGFRLYDAAAVFDHAHDQWYVTAVDWPKATVPGRPSVHSRLAAMRDRLIEAAAHPRPDPPPGLETSTVQSNMTPEAYFSKVGRAKRYIEAGDIYQVNLTQRFTARTDMTPLTVYRRLRQSSPSSHAAYLPWYGATIMSSSPELFLDLRGGHVITRPIKGTRPRTGDPLVDGEHRRQLVTSEKERAELNMIVDLLRNDLGRVCRYGSVRVISDGDIEEHPTVFHRVATIEGDLANGKNWLDLLLASFPGGSITGAPKIRAMQIIDELEPTPRGVYCGSIGWIGLDGAMSLNIAIRTMVQAGETVHLYAGGAIVADSTPEQEYDETLAKAAGMLRAVGGALADLREHAPGQKVTVA